MPQAPAKPRFIGPTRPMTKDDMAATLRPAFKQVISASALRDSHHRVARLAAAGLRHHEIAIKTGFSYQRVGQLLAAPAMIDLVERYRAKVDRAYEASLDNYYETATANMLKAERQIADRLEAADEGEATIAIKDLISVSRDGADRFGYGKRQTQVNLNADFAAELEKAITRSGKAPAVAEATNVIELKPALRRRI